MTVELYTTTWCPHCAAVRDDLEWRGEDFIEYDVEQNAAAYERLLELTGGQRTVPVLVEEGNSIQIGWAGQGCHIQVPNAERRAPRVN